MCKFHPQNLKLKKNLNSGKCECPVKRYCHLFSVFLCNFKEINKRKLKAVELNNPRMHFKNHGENVINLWPSLIGLCGDKLWSVTGAIFGNL